MDKLKLGGIGCGSLIIATVFGEAEVFTGAALLLSLVAATLLLVGTLELEKRFPSRYLLVGGVLYLVGSWVSGLPTFSLIFPSSGLSRANDLTEVYLVLLFLTNPFFLLLMVVGALLSAVGWLFIAVGIYDKRRLIAKAMNTSSLTLPFLASVLMIALIIPEVRARAMGIFGTFLLMLIFFNLSRRSIVEQPNPGSG
ncbi:MAG: hypothetical protein HY558_00215 [Euryarchaeota archaeon]|nr:hypothetical protein [Euryarchaeota archaeon]